MNTFIQTITELFLDRNEFLQIYSPLNKNIKFTEFFCTLFGAISLAISAIIVNPPYNSGYIILIVFLSAANYFFLSMITSFICYFIDFKAKNYIKTGDFPSLNSASRCLNIVYIFSTPISLIVSFIGIPSFSAFFTVILITVFAYVWIFTGYANAIYGMGSFRTFKNILSSMVFILYAPFMIILYIFMNLSVII